jgi:RNA polymerase sigma factor (sigma-70 family)
MDQRAFVERARQGDHDAFAVLAAAAISRLDAAARLILRDRELARDIVQETLLHAWRDLPGLRDPDRFDAWLNRLLTHAAIDETRRRRRRVIEVELTAIDVSDVAADGGFFDRDEIRRAFRRLEPEQRAVIVLRFYLDLSVAETAASLGLPVGTAKSRINRAIAALRAALDADARVPLPRAVGGGR